MVRHDYHNILVYFPKYIPVCIFPTQNLTQTQILAVFVV